MKPTNIDEPEFTWDETDPDGFRAGLARLGVLLGAKETGVSVYELPPGQAVCPYHYECGEEEWLLSSPATRRCGRRMATSSSAAPRGSATTTARSETDARTT